MSLAISLLLSLTLAAFAAGIPWLISAVNRWFLAGALVIGIVISGLIGGLSLAAYPWTDLVVLLVSLSAGILLGRSLPPRDVPMLVLLLVLSALDIAQLTLNHSPSPAHSPTVPPPGQLVGNFFLALPGGHYNLGIFDLFVIACISEHWRRRGASFFLAAAPGLIGLLLAYAVLWLSYRGALPLIPFLLLGWLASLLLPHLQCGRTTSEG